MGSSADVVPPARQRGPSGRGRPRLWDGGVSIVALALVLGVAGAPSAVADKPDVTAGAAKAEVTLRKGDRGPAVAAVQRKLKLERDGIFGPLTHRAVKRFQLRKGLAADGIVGPLTRAALRLKPFGYKSVFRPKKKKRGGAGGGGLAGLPAALVRIADCESGGDPTAVSPSGRYRGKYQFQRSTWTVWGGRGSDPAEASEAHQDSVALRLYRARGPAPWPNCG